MSEEIEPILQKYRQNTRSYLHDNPAYAYSRILVGAGGVLTPHFANYWRISHVINCADDAACPLWVRNACASDQYVCLNSPDNNSVQLINQFYPEFERAMDAFLRSPDCTCVYVHCQAGMNRSATLAAAYVIDRFGTPLSSVIDSMGKQRPCIMTNPSFQRQLAEFASSKKR
jgi:protein-tyrosine phosphatase